MQMSAAAYKSLHCRNIRFAASPFRQHRPPYSLFYYRFTQSAVNAFQYRSQRRFLIFSFAGHGDNCTVLNTCSQNTHDPFCRNRLSLTGESNFAFILRSQLCQYAGRARMQTGGVEDRRFCRYHILHLFSVSRNDTLIPIEGFLSGTF